MKLLPFKSVVGSRKPGSQSGQTLAMFAFTMTSIVSLIAVAIGFGTTQPRPSYTMSLQEAADAAAQAGSAVFKPGYTPSQMETAVQNSLDSNAVVTESLVVETCSTTPGDPALCTTPPRKIVRVSISALVDNVSTQVTSIAEAPSLDVVLLIQNSESMTYAAVDPANRDPHACNPNGCHPFEEVKAAAKDFANTLYFPYDRISVVTFNQIAQLKLMLSDESGGNTVDAALTGLKVYDPPQCVYKYEERLSFPNPVPAPLPGYGGVDPVQPCRLYKTDGAYMGYLDCTMFYATDASGNRTSDNNPVWCGTSNPAAGLALAENTLSTGGYPTSKRVIVMLSTSAPTSAQGDDSHAICPGSTVNPAGFADYTHPGCRDINVLARHCFQNTDTVCLNTNYDVAGNGNPADFMHGTYDPTNYDVYDRAFDMVDRSAANGTNIFTVGVGPQINAISADTSGFAPAASFLKYAAGVTGNIYWYAPDSSSLHAIMLDVGAKVGLPPMAPFAPTSTPTATATSTSIATSTATPTAIGTPDCTLLQFTSTITQTVSAGAPKVQINIRNDDTQSVTITDLSFDWSAYHSIAPSQVGNSWNLDGTLVDDTDYSSSPLNWSGTGPSISGGSSSTLSFIFKNADSNWPGDVTASSFGLTVTFDNLCTISVTPQSTATPTLTPTSTPIITNTPTPPGLMSVRSIAGQDGWVLESSETSNTGGLINATANTFRLGDDAANRQYRGLLSFDTSSLPDTAVITSVVLKIKPNGAPVGSDPFANLGNLLVDLRQGSFGVAALQATDFNALASLQQAGVFKKTPVNGWYTVTFNSPARNSINKTGLTQLRLRFGMDDNNNHLADYLSFYSGNAGNAANHPVLEIQYYLPAPTATSTITSTPTVTFTPTVTPTIPCFDC